VPVIVHIHFWTCSLQSILLLCSPIPFLKKCSFKNSILYRHFIYLFFPLSLCLFVLHLLICFNSMNSVCSSSHVNGCWSKGNKVLVRISEPKKGEITGVYKKNWHCMESLKLFSLPNIVMSKQRHWKWVGLAVCGEIRNPYKIFVRRSEREKIFVSCTNKLDFSFHFKYFLLITFYKIWMNL
jgi:hypothetical protein